MAVKNRNANLSASARPAKKQRKSMFQTTKHRIIQKLEFSVKKTVTEIFKHTKTQPMIFWLPLTDDQV